MPNSPVKEHELYPKYIDFFNSVLTPDKKDMVGPFQKKDAVDILAQICVLESSFSHFNAALEKLESDLAKMVKKKEEELITSSNQQTNRSPKILTPSKKFEVQGLRWPFPTKELTQGKFYGLLNECLLKKEREHGLNLPSKESSTFHLPAKFVGFVDQKEAENYLKESRTWREEMRIAGLFFHGKDTHRIQLVAIMYAMEMGLLNFPDNTSIKDILDLLLSTQTQPKVPIWDAVFDSIFTGIGDVPDTDHPILQDKDESFKELLSNWKQAFFMDPYYVHNYLLNDPKKKFPYLSSCLINTFAKSAFKINEFENIIKFQSEWERKYNFARFNRKETITMDDTLVSQSTFYNITGVHPIDPLVLAAYYREKGDLPQELSIKLKDQKFIDDIYGSYVLSRGKGFILYKPIERLDEDKNVELYQKSMTNLKPNEMSNIVIRFLIDKGVVTANDLNEKSPAEIYKPLRDSISSQLKIDHDLVLHSDQKLNEMSNEEIMQDIIYIVEKIKNEDFEPVNLSVQIPSSKKK